MATQTIAAPLKFSGANKPGEYDAAGFLHEAEARMAGQNITDEAAKLNLVVSALTGLAQEWHAAITIRTDYVQTYTFFKSCFSENFGLPGQTLTSFSHSRIEKQKITESPTDYLGRICRYLKAAVPVANFAEVKNTHRQAYARKYPDLTEADYSWHQAQTLKQCEDNVSDYQRFWMKYFWSNGLITPYSNILKGQNPSKALQTLVQEVQAEGFRRIKRYDYVHHDEAYKAWSSGNKNNNGSKKAVAEVDADEPSADADEVAAAGNGNGRRNVTCSYCDKKGHVARNCKKRSRDKKQQSNSSADKANASKNSKANSDPANPPHIANLLQSVNAVNSVAEPDPSQLSALRQQLADAMASLDATAAKAAPATVGSKPSDFA